MGLSDLLLMVEQEGQELSHKLSLNEKSLVEQEHAIESSLYCKQLVSICVIYFNSRFQSWEILTTEQSRLWLDISRVIYIMEVIYIYYSRNLYYFISIVFETGFFAQLNSMTINPYQFPWKTFYLNIIRNQIPLIQ